MLVLMRLFLLIGILFSELYSARKYLLEVGEAEDGEVKGEKVHGSDYQREDRVPGYTCQVGSHNYYYYLLLLLLLSLLS